MQRRQVDRIGSSRRRQNHSDFPLSCLMPASVEATSSSSDSMENGIAAGMRTLMVSETPKLSRKERRHCEEECDRILCDTISALSKYNGSMDATYWERIGCRDQIGVYKRIAEQGDNEVLRIVGTGYIRGQLEEVTSALYCETDDTLISGEAILSGAPVADGAVLEIFEHRGPHTPFRFAGVKWYANATSDILAYERMGVTLDSDNTDIAYHVVSSLSEHDEWPQIAQLRESSGNPRRKRNTPIGLKRLRPFAMCYVFRRVTEDLVLCFIMGEYWGTKSSRIRRDGEQLLAGRVLMVANAVACNEAKILTQMLEDCEDTPVQMSKACLRCRVTRNMVHDTLRVCGICRKSVCRECRVMKSICHLDEHTRLADSEAFCTKCLSRINISLTPTALSRPPSEKIDRHQPASPAEKPVKERRVKRLVSTPTAHAYNYDELILKRGGSETSDSSISSNSDPRAEKQPLRRREYRIVLASEKTMEKTDSESNRSDDLYLSGENAASEEAERQFHRYLERRLTLDLESLRKPRRRRDESSPPPATPAVPVRTQPEQQPVPKATRPDAAGRAQEPKQPRSNPRVPSVDKKMKKRDFYRDLYTEL